MANILFQDNFNRTNGAVGNGWLDSIDDIASSLVISNNSLSISGGGTSGIYRPIDLSNPITVSVDVTQENGFGGLLNRYNTQFLFGSDGHLASGYGIELYRGDQNFSNSAVRLWYNGVIIATAASNFQFGAALHVNFTLAADHSIVGTVTGDGNTFSFNFGAQQIQFSGNNLEIVTSSADPNVPVVTEPTIDNLVISAVGNHTPTPTPDTASVQKAHTITGNVLANDHDPDGDTLHVSAVSFNGTNEPLGQTFPGTYGKLTINADGSYKYVANNGIPAFGNLSQVQDVFSYTVDDGHGGTANSTITIAVGNKDLTPIFSSAADKADAMSFLSWAAYDYSSTNGAGHIKAVTAVDNLNGSVWIPLDAKALGLPSDDFKDGFYVNGNAAALVAINTDKHVMAIAFRGSDDNIDRLDLIDALPPLLTQSNNFDLLRPVIDAALNFQKNHLAQYPELYVTGHSFGGSMAEWFASNYDSNIPTGVNVSINTFASPGVDFFPEQTSLVTSIVNFGFAADPIFNILPEVLNGKLGRDGTDVVIDLTQLSPPSGFSLPDFFSAAFNLDAHQSSRYSETLLQLNKSGWGNAVLSSNPPDVVIDGDGQNWNFSDVIEPRLGTDLDAHLFLGLDGNDTISSGFGRDILDGGNGNDVLIANGKQDTLQGGPGADKFVINNYDTSGAVKHNITDYDQGNSGKFKKNEGDTIDLAPIPFNTPTGHAIPSLIRAIEDQSGSFSNLQIDPSGGKAESAWINIIRLDNVHSGDSLSIILDSAHTMASIAVGPLHVV